MMKSTRVGRIRRNLKMVNDHTLCINLRWCELGVSLCMTLYDLFWIYFAIYLLPSVMLLSCGVKSLIYCHLNLNFVSFKLWHEFVCPI
jgi:hypothetical protein